MSKICPKCNKEWQDDFMACPHDGTPLISKPQQPAGFSLNLGDANAISGGVNMSDNHSINTTSNVDSHNVITNNITQVERDKTPEELKHEREFKFRVACLEVYSNGIMTSEQKRKLEDLQYRLGLDESSASKILSEVAKRSERKSSSLSPVHQITFNNIKTAINSNRLDLVNRLLAQMKAMVQRYSVEEIQFTYYMLQAVLHPKECVQEFESQFEDDYWQTFWTSVAYCRVGNNNQSANLEGTLNSKWQGAPTDDGLILMSVNALLCNDVDIAKSYIENLIGDHSSVLYNLSSSLTAILYSEVLDKEQLKEFKKNGAFYTNNLFSDIVNQISAENRKLEEAEAKRIAEEKRIQEEAEAKRLTEEKRMQEEAEAKRLAEEKRMQEKAEAKRLTEEKRMQEEAEKKCMQEEAEAKLLAEEIQQISDSSTPFDIKTLAPYTNKFGYLRSISDEEIHELKAILISAPTDNYQAKFCIGQLYLQENETAVNQKQAYDAIKSASENGVYEAGAFMAYFYLYGKVVEQDLDEAERRIKIDDDYKKNPIFIQMLIDLYTQKGNTMLADVWKSKLLKVRSLMNMAIYSGYGGGIPVYTIRDNQVFKGYGGGIPVYTIRDNQIFEGYGGGIPVYTIRY